MRVTLRGTSGPIPLEALPGPGGDALDQILLNLPTGDFPVTEYIDAGFTHYEVFCVGAAGGFGSDGYAGVSWPYYSVGGVTHWYLPFLANMIACGGAGGGGGIHRFAGLLADLPDIAPVVVGQAGTKGENADLVIEADEVVPPPGLSGDNYDLPHRNFLTPRNGGDGGYSSFADICQASGGKGGGASAIWMDSESNPLWVKERYKGPGGAGGAGDRIIAGGGALGGHSDPTYVPFGSPGAGDYIEHVSTPPGDGGWDPETGVGTGGGGGHAGFVVPGQYGGSGQVIREPLTVLASNGGKGAFSYGDPSVYGERGNRANPTIEDTEDPPTPNPAAPVDHYNEPVSLTFGKACLAGAGGGAKVNQLLKYGSHAPGYDPNGLVLIKLVKIA